MAIAASDIVVFYPAVTAEGGTHGGSSTASAIGTTKNALWDDVTGQEAQDSATEYRKVFIGLSTSAGSQVGSNMVVWVASTTPGGDEIYMKTVTVAGDTVNVQTDITAGTDWAAPTSKAAGVSFGTIATAQTMPVWLKRIVPAATAAYANNTQVLRVEMETA